MRKVCDRERNEDQTLVFGELIRKDSERVLWRPARPLWFPVEVSRRTARTHTGTPTQV